MIFLYIFGYLIIATVTMAVIYASEHNYRAQNDDLPIIGMSMCWPLIIPIALVYGMFRLAKYIVDYIRLPEKVAKKLGRE